MSEAERNPSRTTNIQTAAIALLSFSGLASQAQADVTIRTRMSAGQTAMESTLYAHDERQRIDVGSATAMMQQSDRKRTIQLDKRSKTYVVLPFDAEAAAAVRSADAKKGGTIEIETNVTDLGERKQTFGFEARHLRVGSTRPASPDACNPGRSRTEIDGWYIDFKLPNQERFTTMRGRLLPRSVHDLRSWSAIRFMRPCGPGSSRKVR